jgi:hypothetical protein
MVYPFPYPGPVPYGTNFPINAQYFQPSRFVISNVTLGETTTITTTTNMNYVIGQLCRLIIPPSFGCYQLNESEGYVISIPAANQVVLEINSSENVGAYQASSATTVAQILAIGDINQGIISSTGANIPSTNIPGAFINISPL